MSASQQPTRFCLAQLADRDGRPTYHDRQSCCSRPLGCSRWASSVARNSTIVSDVDRVFRYGEEGSVFREPPGKRQAPVRQDTRTSFSTTRRVVSRRGFSADAPKAMLYRIDCGCVRRAIPAPQPSLAATKILRFPVVKTLGTHRCSSSALRRRR